MDFRTHLRSSLESVSRAVADTLLQMRAKPLVFIQIWLVLTLAPQIMLSLIFWKPLSSLMTVMIGFTGGSVNLSEDAMGIIRKGFQAAAASSVIVAFLTVYRAAVLAGVVGRFHSGKLPMFTTALQDGVGRFPAFFKAVMSSALRILALVVPGYFIGLLIGILTGDWMFTPVFTTGIALFIGFLNFGLGPFIHLALNCPGGDAARLSRIFYRAWKLKVTALFVGTIVLPFLIVSIFSNLLVQTNSFVNLGFIISQVFQSIALFAATVVYLNFAQNTFAAEEKAVEADDEA